MRQKLREQPSHRSRIETKVIEAALAVNGNRPLSDHASDVIQQLAFGLADLNDGAQVMRSVRTALPTALPANESNMALAINDAGQIPEIGVRQLPHGFALGNHYVT